MVQDSGRGEEERVEGRPDADPGWEEFNRAESILGNYSRETTWEDVPVKVVFSWDSDPVGDMDGPDYLVVEKVFVGDDFKLFDITGLLVENEDFAIMLESEVKEIDC